MVLEPSRANHGKTRCLRPDALPLKRSTSLCVSKELRAPRMAGSGARTAIDGWLPRLFPVVRSHGYSSPGGYR